MKSRWHGLPWLAVVALLFLAASSVQAAGAEEFARGQVIEKVVCKADAQQAYALYLPSGYTPDKRWPILYAFDPRAEGKTPVELFREAAERYGWIVVGSLNSQNGPSVNNSKDAPKAMWEDTHARFSIDDGRVYTTGFSGGARLASWIAYSCKGCVAGVIACGAGFNTRMNINKSTPAAELPFVLFGTVGTDDFNFGELKNLDNLLSSIKIPHRITVFEGGHMWPPKELSTRAVEWMEIEAMKAGKRAKDEALIEELWKREMERAGAAESSKKIYDAYLAYAALVTDFRGLRSVSEAESKLSLLRETAEVKRAIREDAEQIRRQDELTNQLLALQEQRKDVEARTTAYGEFRRILDDLRKKAREPEDSMERRLARRTRSNVFAIYYETGWNLLQGRKDYAAAVANLEVAAQIADQNPQVQYELAQAYALNGEKKKALEALRRAVEKGFNDSAQMNSSQALEPLRKEAEYQKILESMKPRP
jgi:predicted esterase